MDSAVIQELIVCSPHLVSAVAEKHSLTPSGAQVVRDQWIRRIISRCVQCNVLVTGDHCPRCKTPKQSAVKLLQEIKPKEVILRRECDCGRPFYYTAGYILKMYSQKGAFKPSRKCPQCRAEAKGEEFKRPTPKKVAIKKLNHRLKTKKVKAMRPVSPARKKPNKGLTYRPFEGLAGLKLKN